MIKAIELTPQMIEAARKRGRELRSEAFHNMMRSIGQGIRRFFRAYARHDPAKRPDQGAALRDSRYSLMVNSRVGWL